MRATDMHGRTFDSRRLIQLQAGAPLTYILGSDFIPDGTLILNGGAELDVDGNLKPDYWYMASTQERVTIERSAVDPIERRYCFCVSDESAEFGSGPVLRSYAQDIPENVGKLKVTWHSKASGWNSGLPRIGIRYFDGSIEEGGPSGSFVRFDYKSPKSSKEWRKVVVESVVPSEAKSFDFVVQIDKVEARGVLYIDAISIVNVQ